MLQWKSAQLAVRKVVGSPTNEIEFNPILQGGKLTQQWIVDSHLQVEANNLNYIRTHQSQLRVEQYKGLSDYIHNAAEAAGLPPGRKVILPSTFQGSPRNMREKYHDAMAITLKFGNPTPFVTFTCNPNWDEIVQNLLPGQIPSDRPDLVARVFNIKLNELIKDLTYKNVTGKSVAYVYVVEFQKRGLPHAHILVIFSEEDRPREPADIDKLVCAEIPDKSKSPRLYEIVTRCMIHGPCGVLNPRSPCMDSEGKCKKKFPKYYINNTHIPDKGWPLYQRRKGPTHFVNNKPVDNRWVVPYNPWLSLKYNAHINVEICTSADCLKYLFKYLYKGYDCATVNIRHRPEGAHATFDYDEVSKYEDTRFVSAPEGAHRLGENKMHGRSHWIDRLPCHLPFQQPVYFNPGQEEIALMRSAMSNTKLTAWFNLNMTDPNANQYLYTEIPEHYVLDNNKCWNPRKRGGEKIISRMVSVNPREQERFHLRILLLHVRGATGYEPIRTVDGVLCETFKDAAIRRHLLADDTEWNNCMTETCTTAMPKQIRLTFAFILVFCNPSEPVKLWDTHKVFMIEDYARHATQAVAEQMALLDINEILTFHGIKIADLGLPEPQPLTPFVNSLYDIVEESSKADDRIQTLNTMQKHGFDVISDSITRADNPKRVFFVDGPGGSGKTYLYNTLMHWTRGQSKTVLPHATTGIAALLLEGGRTMHSGFKLPVPLLETSTSSMRLNSPQAISIREASLLLIDEATMASANALRCVDILLKEIMSNQLPFGGKVLVLGGDFRQMLPVVVRGTRTKIVEACIKSSHLWSHVTQITLVDNMRTGTANVDHNKWLLSIGDGSLKNNAGLAEDIIEIPPSMVESGDIVTSIFGNTFSTTNYHEHTNKVILSPKNDDTHVINDKIVGLIPGESQMYFSADSIDADTPEEVAKFPTEFLNRQTTSGMPPHSLKLKVGTVVMILRNMSGGLCNGTRLIIKAMHANFLDLEVLTGRTAGERIFLPRITLAPTESGLPFVLRRTQFPLRIAFAMTISKSQGQTFDSVGINLNDPVFTHGQLYVALSRCRNPDNIKVLIRNTGCQGQLIAKSARTFTRNVVFQEVLQSTMDTRTLQWEDEDLPLPDADGESALELEMGFLDPTFPDPDHDMFPDDAQLQQILNDLQEQEQKPEPDFSGLEGLEFEPEPFPNWQAGGDVALLNDDENSAIEEDSEDDDLDFILNVL